MIPSTWDHEVDVVVAGSGGGGLAAAIVAHDAGLRSVVLEAAAQLGGATALSQGSIWIPMNDGQQAAGIEDNREAAITHMLATARGAGIPESRSMVETYVDNAPTVVREISRLTPLRYNALLNFPDYRMDLPGSRRGRTMVPALFEGSQLGDWAPRVRKSITVPPIGLDEIDQLGGPGHMMEINPAVIGERLRNDTRAAGAAGIAALVRGCLDRGIPMLLGHAVTQLIGDSGRVVGARVKQANQELSFQARAGVMLATGGAEWDATNNRRNLLKPFDGAVTPPGNRGDGQRFGVELGLPLALMHESSWVPAFKVPGELLDGQQMFRNCILEREFPHSIIVNRAGKRFADEGLPYNDFVHAGPHLWDPVRYDYPNYPMWLIVDQQYRERYPLAGVLPQSATPDWMARSETLADLATMLEIDCDGFVQTIERFNTAAREGQDLDFHRGESMYSRYYGDPRHEPNPCLGTLEKPPYYGLPLYVSTYGHKGGLITDRHAQVLDVHDKPVLGLYALGNTAASFHHNIGYTGGGLLGRALIFGYLAAKHAAQVGS